MVASFSASNRWRNDEKTKQEANKKKSNPLKRDTEEEM
jgi:hypothetical protein